MSLNVKSIGSNKAELQVENGNPITIDATGNLDVHSLNGAQLGGFRNKILNGRFNVNQSGAASRIATPNAYNFDQWFYDGTYLYQPIPTEDVEDGTYTLSWTGDSTAAWSLNAASSLDQGSESYTAVDNGGQIVVSGHTNEHLWVRFQGDLLNLDKVQLESGSMATPFEERFKSLELSLCQWFYEAIIGVAIYFSAPGSTPMSGQSAYISFNSTKRSTPAMVFTALYGSNHSFFSPNRNGCTFRGNPDSNGVIGANIWASSRI